MSKLFFSCHGMSGQNIPCHGMCGCFFSYQGMAGQNQPNRPSWAAYSKVKCRKWSALVFDRASNQTNHPECSTLKQNPDRQTGRQTDRQTIRHTDKQTDTVGPKPLPEPLIFIARQPFFGLDQISVFRSLQEAILRHFLPWPKTIARTAHFHCARTIFRSGPNIWFGSLQNAVLRHFWPLAQHHCQNGSFSLRAGHFSVWSEYLVFGVSVH